MVDLMSSLASLQQAIDTEVVDLQDCQLFADLKIYFDQPNGKMRFTYVIQKEKKVQAIAVFALTQTLAGEHCFQIAYAVEEKYRRQGLGSKITKQGLAELKNDLKNMPFKSYVVQAIVAINNNSANQIAIREISSNPVVHKNSMSGQDTFHYLANISL
jgi:hypothetical protein